MWAVTDFSIATSDHFGSHIGSLDTQQLLLYSVLHRHTHILSCCSTLCISWFNQNWLRKCRCQWTQRSSSDLVEAAVASVRNYLPIVAGRRRSVVRTKTLIHEVVGSSPASGVSAPQRMGVGRQRKWHRPGKKSSNLSQTCTWGSSTVPTAAGGA